MNNTQVVTLETLGGGAAAELFQKELENAIVDICDPNKLAEKERTVILKVKIKPGKDRSLCSTEITCESKLAPASSFTTNMFVGIQNGKGVATEYVQGGLFDEKVDVKTGEVIRMVK